MANSLRKVEHRQHELKVDPRILPWPLKAPAIAIFILGSFAGKCLAPETPKEPGIRERGLLAGSYLRQRLVRWQERLKLQDWTISLVMSHPTDLRRGTLGNVHWDADKKTAVIRVLDAADYGRPFRATLEDMEFTVVHELIHLELTSLTRSFKSRSEESFSEEEQAVNRMSYALLQLDHADQSVRLNAAASSTRPLF
jgi:hypothetical protein